MEERTSYEGYAVVELMGHNTIAGYISEQSVAGVAMLRIDVPAVEGREKFTKFVSGAAIYGITPTSQEVAEHAASRLRVTPVSEYVVPVPPSRPQLIDGLPELVEEDDELQDAW